uniref:Uncharacterized protein n=1 Tax=Ditylenchus dipsaci TaxID=166011 RepID=A0A915EIS4_9BILA
MGSEKLDQCHLYLHNFNLAGDKTGHSEMAITRARTGMCSKKPTCQWITTVICVCVASYGSYQECCVLTPEDLSYKFERSQPKLNLIQTLQYPPDHADSSKHIHPFPTAVFAYRISIQAQLSLHSSIPTVQSTSPSSDFSSSANLNAAISNLPSSGQPSLYNSPSSIFNRKFFKYHSNISNKVHYAVLLWPTDPKWTVDGKKFPVIQHVYAGPSIQNVKDSCLVWLNTSNL